MPIIDGKELSNGSSKSTFDRLPFLWHSTCFLDYLVILVGCAFCSFWVNGASSFWALLPPPLKISSTPPSYSKLPK